MKRYIHTADAVFALILFCAFAVSMLMVLMTGAQAYQGVRNRVENHYSEDTVVSYIAMKLRHYDAEDCNVTVSKIAGNDALIMTETISGNEIITAIYFHEGFVKELYAEASYEFTPDDGTNILAAQEISITKSDNGVISVRCVGTGGSVAETKLALRSEVGA